MIRRLRGLTDRAQTGSKNHGFALVEIMIATLLLLVAMAGIVPFFITGLSQASAVRYKSIATNIAREKMEQIRQLDYREIVDAQFLRDRFGTAETQRDIDFIIDYAVEISGFGAGNLKKVTVDVSWADTPYVSAASMTTLIHQQFLGPRISYLEIEPTKNDELGTPFQRLHDKHQGELTGTRIKIHIAEADWGLVYNNLNQVGMAARDVYARLVLFDADGQPFQLGDPDDEYRITDLRNTTEDGKVTDVYFYYQFDSTDIPDGYWEVRATVYNEYDEPGNVWRVGIRVENGPPGTPFDFIATPQPDNQTVVLTWYGGPERDRAYYILQRQKWDGASWPGDWVTLASGLDPKATTFTDQGHIDTDDPGASTDPWGDEFNQNVYQYRLWAVDIANRSNEGGAALAEATIPDSAATTTTTTLIDDTTTTTTSTSSTTTTVFTTGWGQVVNTINKVYTVTVKDSDGDTVFSGTVDKKGTIKIDGLPAGMYNITAVSSGKPPVIGFFSMPDDNGQIILEIL